jgi:drug/metabolite transporter (DMT)-like permease
MADNYSIHTSHSSRVLNIYSNNVRNIKFIIFNIIIGQILAIIGVGNGKISEIIENEKGIILPLILTSIYYLLLFILWMIINRKIVKPKLTYILITIFDSQANFINVYAFHIIHFNYLFIINVCSVFWTVLITWIFIKRYKYKPIHILAVGISILGIALSLYGCISRIDDTDEQSQNYTGLIICLVSSICYSMYINLI